MRIRLATLAILAHVGLIAATDVCAQQAKSVNPTLNCNPIHLPGLNDIVPGGKPYTITWGVSTSVLPTAPIADADPHSLEQYRAIRLPCTLPRSRV